MKTLCEAFTTVSEPAWTLAIERTPFEKVGGRVLAETIRSDMDIQPFEVSATERFACRAKDRGKELCAVETIAAGLGNSY